MPDSIIKNAPEIDKLLSDIKICDPAVGSGAFPVGLMHEVIKLRNILAIYLQNENCTQYDLKRQFIEHSFYAVDIDDGATEIARLRLWLSLVVDEEDIDQIKPLPNLDYKIVKGNSLIGFPKDWRSEAFTKIEDLQNQHISETNPSRKNDLKATIDNLIEKQLNNSEKVFGSKINFDFRLFFPEVFRHKDGFDIVIGNPPYIQLQKAFNSKIKFADLYKD